MNEILTDNDLKDIIKKYICKINKIRRLTKELFSLCFRRFKINNMNGYTVIKNSKLNYFMELEDRYSQIQIISKNLTNILKNKD